MKVGDVLLGPPKICLFGPAGVGKSALAMTLGERASLYDFDKGFATGKTLIDPFTADRRKVDIVGPMENGQPTGYTDSNPKAPKAWKAFKADIQYLAQVCQAKPAQYVGKAWIFDSLTTMFECALRDVLANSGDAFRNPEIQHWGIAFSEILNHLAIIRTLPGVVILVAHDQRDEIKLTKDDKNPRPILELAVPGKNLPSKIISFFDEVWLMNSEIAPGGGFRRTLQTAKDPLVNCRSRLQLADRTNAEIGLPAILEKVGYKFPN